MSTENEKNKETENKKNCNTKKDNEKGKQGKDNWYKSRHRDGNKRPAKTSQEPFWYAKDQKAIENMASFPWNNVVGSFITKSRADAIPGIVTIPYLPTIGYSDANTGISQATRAANAYFQYLTQGFTGGVNFEAPDLLFSALAAESLFAFLIEGKRAYGLMRYYLQSNKYFAESIVDALGFKFADLKANLANFRTEYNLRVSQINATIAVPKDFFIGDRWEFLSSNVFTDTSSPEYSTMYAYRQAARLEYSPTAKPTGTALSWHSTTGSTWTVAEFFAEVDHLITKLTGDDQRDMFGALRRVYSADQLKKVSELDPDFILSIAQNDVVSAQVHNGMYFDSVHDDNTENQDLNHNGIPIYQDAQGNIISKQYGIASIDTADNAGNQSSLDYVPDKYILDMYDQMVSPATTLDTTATITPMSETETLDIHPTGAPVTFRMRLLYPRTEICLLPQVKITRFYNNEVVVQEPRVRTVVVRESQSGGWMTNMRSAALDIAALSHLDSHPLIHIVDTEEPASGISKGTLQCYLGEIDRYTLLSGDDIRQMNEQAQFTLLAMPANTKSVSK